MIPSVYLRVHSTLHCYQLMDACANIPVPRGDDDFSHTIDSFGDDASLAVAIVSAICALDTCYFLPRSRVIKIGCLGPSLDLHRVFFSRSLLLTDHRFLHTEFALCLHRTLKGFDANETLARTPRKSQQSIIAVQVFSDWQELQIPYQHHQHDSKIGQSEFPT